MSDRLVDACDALDAALLDLHRVLYDGAGLDAHPVDDLVRVLARLDRRTGHARPGIKQALGALVDDLASHLNPRLPFAKPYTVEGVGTIERCLVGGSTSWENGDTIARRVAARAAERACVDADGVVLDSPPPPAVVADAVATELLACTPMATKSFGWKLPALRARNIDPNDYLTRSNRRPSARWSD